MTIDEAKKIAAICSTADHRCSNCVEALYVLLQEAFPAISWTFDEDRYYDQQEDYIQVGDK